MKENSDSIHNNQQSEEQNDLSNQNPELISKLWEEVKKVYDPEIGFSIVDLGLVYDIWTEGNKAFVKMTLTSMGCPAGPYLEHEVKEACKRVNGIEEAIVEITFSPPWDPREMASEEVKMMLGIY
ncbi:MAG: metal-sulfur cluster assembly factor [Leptospiraceae bacterium]|nr:metal-sulfur cluster assembly factor [Leptospiraceae bacterium]